MKASGRFLRSKKGDSEGIVFSVRAQLPRSVLRALSPRREGLPSFRKPPVNEVVLGVSFKPLTRLRITDLGHLQAALAENYPTLEEHPPYYPPIEQFGPTGFAASLSVDLTVMDWPRLWFLSLDNERLVQFQRNWLAFNWRKISPGSEYQRWQAVRESFVSAFLALDTVVHSATDENVVPLQCEVSYINEIGISDLGITAGQLWRVLRVACPTPEGSLPTPEQMALQLQYPMADGEQTVGRLHLTTQPAKRRKDGSDVLVINLTARGRPNSSNLDGVLAFLDLASERIVDSFGALTTDEMHDIWEQEN